MKRGLHRRNRIFHFKIKMPDGKWHERTTHSENYQQALTVKATTERELEQGLLPSDRHRWTLERAAAEWLDYHTRFIVTNALGQPQADQVSTSC
jgi:hypothetical protein